MDLEEFRGALDSWLDAHADQLAPEEGAHASLDGDMAQLSKVKRLAYDAGWMRWGWPERVGGLGGSPLLRGYLGEALTTRGLVEPGIYSMTEVLAPTMIDHADPALAAEMVPRLLRDPGALGRGRGVARRRAEGVDEPRPVRPPLCAAGAHRHGRGGPPGHQRAVRRHGLPGRHGAADRDDARPARVLRGVLRRGR